MTIYKQYNDFKLRILYIWLINWGRAAHIYVSKLPIIDSANGLLLGRRQTIIKPTLGYCLLDH